MVVKVIKHPQPRKRHSNKGRRKIGDWGGGGQQSYIRVNRL